MKHLLRLSRVHAGEQAAPCIDVALVCVGAASDRPAREVSCDKHICMLVRQWRVSDNGGLRVGRVSADRLQAADVVVGGSVPARSMTRARLSASDGNRCRFRDSENSQLGRDGIQLRPRWYGCHLKGDTL